MQYMIVAWNYMHTYILRIQLYLSYYMLVPYSTHTSKKVQQPNMILYSIHLYEEYLKRNDSTWYWHACIYIRCIIPYILFNSVLLLLVHTCACSCLFIRDYIFVVV